MSFSPFSSKLHLRRLSGVACLAFSLVSHAADPRGGRPIEITPPRSQSINTNVNQLRLSGLKNLEADLSKPFQTLSPQTSLEGMMAPQVLPQPQPRPALTQKEKEQRDRQRNWAFMAPEELGPNMTPEKIFGLKEYGADGLEKKNRTTVERFTDRMNAMATNQLATSDSNATNMWGDSSPTDSGQPGNVFTTMNPSVAVFKPARQPDVASDVFSFHTSRDADDILREQKAQKTQMENFRQVWNFDQGSSAATPGFQNPGFTSDNTPNPTKTFQPVLGTVTPSPLTPAPSSLTPQPPATTPARTTTFQPSYTAPQRRF